MAKINITRLPNATQEYDAGQFDQMIRLLEQIVFLLNTNFQQDLKEEAEAEAGERGAAGAAAPRGGQVALP